MNVEIVNKSSNELPEYASIGAAAMDLRSNENLVIEPGDTEGVKTGLYMAIESGYEAQIRPRSGLALKNGITVLNAPGTIDCDYRGEIKVILANFGKFDFRINVGDRIAQILFSEAKQASLVEKDDVCELGQTERGDGGFGHTGVE